MMRPYFFICVFTILYFILIVCNVSTAQEYRTMNDAERKAEEKKLLSRGGFGPCNCKKGPGKFCGWEMGCQCDTIYTCEKKGELAKADLKCKEEGRPMGQSCSSAGQPLNTKRPPTCTGASESP